ncbi:T9SS type A sorting domain-containing protein [Subsaximicrobium wynnwilliamsii]|uniref:T9SS type A sorting domain-containing protein n=1 Tax=Subsaximicrobium wynnwilliamsii TaxID=291179 RepID=A0A5C6ZD09_9FLAO|nr:endonuclease [Subsaximicrobium wynnwilliamsii]TXD81858.1 T9SS type A sorting domain-containing protein [Subsaximicrobium wynnwilliamsii]TXD87527.1 T9SS type A sorting domain-containing protein [Subsaximicrobium wynnwilliamsii]TXE01210.1 T9SS type A sorting domain-containing protein [Subsaximicrobium wynnwilliamsii]
MKQLLLIVSALIFMPYSFAQVVINELDCDTPSTDDREFVELLTATPEAALDGYVLVFFNGSNSGGNSSYFALDLDGYVSDVNGLLLIGSNDVSPVPQVLISANTIQNGPDAVAIYQADDLDFPEFTVATIDNLIDVLLYDTSDPDDQDMIAIFSADPRFTSIEQINEGPGNNTNSIQRFEDASGNVTYTSTVPTPRQLNDGSGIVLNGIRIDLEQRQYDEDASFNITFTSETPVVETLDFNILFDNDTFDTNDFTGNTSLSIPMGTTSTMTSINLIDDALDEGDEVTRLRFESLPSGYLALNNNIAIRIVDNDYTASGFGTPVNPTFGNVSSTQPSGYYNSLDALGDTNLRQALQDIIADPSIVREQSYADVIDILKEADQNPEHSNQVWLVYTEQGRPKLDFQVNNQITGKWNREHTFPRSRGGFFSIEEDEIADGKDLFWTTSADSLRHGNSDAHALRAADGIENSTRNNQFYGQYTGPAGTQGSFYGDVARSVFYMAIRYNGLEVVNGYPEGNLGQMGDLATLLDWHRNDPPDDFEMNRNNLIQTWQFNRNPFIDQPDLVEYIWGNNTGDLWSQALGVTDFNANNIFIYPNPAGNSIYVKGLVAETTIAVFSMEGRKIKTFRRDANCKLDLDLPPGIYLLHFYSENKQRVKKLVIK